MIQLGIQDKEFKLPESWDEVVNCGTMDKTYQALASEQPDRELKVMMAMSGIDRDWFIKAMRNIDNVIYVSSQILDEVLPIIQFAFDPATVKNIPFPVIEVHGKKYQHNNTMLRDQKGYSWEVSHHALSNWSVKKDPKWLKILMAANYSIAGKELQEKDINSQIELFEKVPYHQAYAYLLWYQNCEKIWRDRYPYMFAQQESEGDSKSTSEPDSMAIRKLIFELAENKMDKTWDEVKNRTRQDILFGLDCLEEKRIKKES